MTADNRTGTEPIHSYDVTYDWDNVDITEHADRGYSVRMPVTSTTDPKARYVTAIRLADGKAALRVHDADLGLLAFRFDDPVANEFVRNVEDNFLVPQCGQEALDERAGYRNRKVTP